MYAPMGGDADGVVAGIATVWGAGGDSWSGELSARSRSESINMVGGIKKGQYFDSLPFPSRFLYGPLLTPFFLSLRCESIHSSAIPYLTQRRQGRASSHFLQAF